MWQRIEGVLVGHSRGGKGCCGRKKHNMATVRMRKKSNKWKWSWHEEYQKEVGWVIRQCERLLFTYGK